MLGDDSNTSTTPAIVFSSLYAGTIAVTFMFTPRIFQWPHVFFIS
jgi:hypothetical protein